MAMYYSLSIWGYEVFFLEKQQYPWKSWLPEIIPVTAVISSRLVIYSHETSLCIRWREKFLSTMDFDHPQHETNKNICKLSRMQGSSVTLQVLSWLQSFYVRIVHCQAWASTEGGLLRGCASYCLDRFQRYRKSRLRSVQWLFMGQVCTRLITNTSL